MMKTEFPERYMLVDRLAQEQSFISEVESVLKDVATHLPDLSPR